jgi:hypothetical protein
LRYGKKPTNITDESRSPNYLLSTDENERKKKKNKKKNKKRKKNKSAYSEVYLRLN